MNYETRKFQTWVNMGSQVIHKSPEKSTSNSLKQNFCLSGLNLIFSFKKISLLTSKLNIELIDKLVVFVFVLMGWSLLPNALRPFKIYCAPPNLDIRT